VPWKGLQNIDPENDPNMTPGSVPSGPTINTNIQDVNRYLLRDRSGGKRTNHLFSSKNQSSLSVNLLSDDTGATKPEQIPLSYHF